MWCLRGLLLLVLVAFGLIVDLTCAAGSVSDVPVQIEVRVCCVLCFIFHLLLQSKSTLLNTVWPYVPTLLRF